MAGGGEGELSPETSSPLCQVIRAVAQNSDGIFWHWPLATAVTQHKRVQCSQKKSKRCLSPGQQLTFKVGAEHTASWQMPDKSPCLQVDSHRLYLSDGECGVM